MENLEAKPSRCPSIVTRTKLGSIRRASFEEKAWRGPLGRRSLAQIGHRDVILDLMARPAIVAAVLGQCRGSAVAVPWHHIPPGMALKKVGCKLWHSAATCCHALRFLHGLFVCGIPTALSELGFGFSVTLRSFSFSVRKVALAVFEMAF